MAFNGTLIAVGSEPTPIPYKYIKVMKCDITPDQRMELSAKHVSTGELYRKTAPHTSTKIEFETPHLYNNDVAALISLITSNFIDILQREISVTYFDPETNSHKTGTFYVPAIKYSVDHIEGTRILYQPIRIAFIEC